MTKFLYIYTGGNPPADAAEGEKVMAAWIAYFGKLGPHVVDAGAPTGARMSVAGAPASGISGYSIVEAADLRQAVSFTDGHPHIASGGAIEVVETVPIPM